jgi:hypothetical protein
MTVKKLGTATALSWRVSWRVGDNRRPVWERSRIALVGLPLPLRPPRAQANVAAELIRHGDRIVLSYTFSSGLADGARERNLNAKPVRLACAV